MFLIREVKWTMQPSNVLSIRWTSSTISGERIFPISLPQSECGGKQHLWEFVPTDVGAVETVREILECILPVRARLDRKDKKALQEMRME